MMINDNDNIVFINNSEDIVLINDCGDHYRSLLLLILDVFYVNYRETVWIVAYGISADTELVFFLDFFINFSSNI